MNRLLRPAIALALVVVASTALGATRYVTDELRITVRTGSGQQYRIIEIVDSGTRLETSETSGDWTRVRTPEGNTGWVQAKYLTDTPIAEDRLRNVRAELASARERITELEQELAGARGSTDSAQERIDELTATRETLEERLAAAEEGLTLHAENERLDETVTALREQVKSLRAETTRLADRSRKEWFVLGGGVLLGGILFGIVVTRIPWRRSRDRLF